jgi:hypothetical protein
MLYRQIEHFLVSGFLRSFVFQYGWGWTLQSETEANTMEKLRARVHRITKVLKTLIKITETTIAKLIDEIVGLGYPEIIVKRGKYCVRKINGKNVLCFKPNHDKFGRSEPFLEKVTLDTDAQEIVDFLEDVPEIIAVIAEKKANT